MATQFDIRPMVEKNSSLPIERLRVLSNFEDLRLRDMRRGVVFVFAAWSGPAVLALRRFTQIMAEIATDALDLVILDIDCLTPDSAAVLFGTDGFRAGGYGETIWVSEGLVVAREIASPPAERAIREHTKDILDDENG